MKGKLHLPGSQTSQEKAQVGWYHQEGTMRQILHVENTKSELDSTSAPKKNDFYLHSEGFFAHNIDTK